MTPNWWSAVFGPTLAQGDMLRGCLLPVFTGETSTIATVPIKQPLRRANLIIITQSCDLENNKVEFVALCPISSLAEFELTNAEYKKKGRWETVRKGRVEGLHLLASPEVPTDNQAALVVDFGQIVSLPFDYLCSHAASLGQRFRLSSPFLEHFSQAFARFFMRVGLPSTIEPFK